MKTAWHPNFVSCAPSFIPNSVLIDLLLLRILMAMDDLASILVSQCEFLHGTDGATSVFAADIDGDGHILLGTTRFYCNRPFHRCDHQRGRSPIHLRGYNGDGH